MNMLLCRFVFGLGFNSSILFGNKSFNSLDVAVGYRRRVGMAKEAQSFSASKRLPWRGWASFSSAITATKH